MKKQVYLLTIGFQLLSGIPAFSKGKPVNDLSASNNEDRQRQVRKACLEGDYAKRVSLLAFGPGLAGASLRGAF
jgi:hypothetical protein